MAINPSIHHSGKDHRLYILVAVFIPLIVLTGFARTYYLKSFFGTPALPGLLVHLHGIVMTSWVVLFVTQVSLVAAVNLLMPAITRIPLHFIETGGPLTFFGLTDLCAVRGFSEALRAELCGSSVSLTCVYSGPVNTIWLEIHAPGILPGNISRQSSLRSVGCRLGVWPDALWMESRNGARVFSSGRRLTCSTSWRDSFRF